jgi:glyceraldehyde-3-phosphate dehydrogenase (NADP+)
MDAIPGAETKKGYWYRVPIGVIGAITPFNLPLSLAAHKVAPALAAGNSVVLKPATVTPLTDLKMGEILLDSGCPTNALNIITGGGAEVGGTIVRNEVPRMISFTGSRKVGNEILHTAGFKKVVLELGGNAAAIVSRSADLEKAATSMVRGGFTLAGQICISVQRILIHNAIMDEFLHILIPKVNNLKVGDPMQEDTEFGPMINEEQAQRTMDWIEDALRAGGKLLAGGHREGTLLHPTILQDVPMEAKVCREEVFAPVVTVIGFDTIEEAIELSNDSIYGLQAGIFTNDINEAMNAAYKLDVGGVVINDVPTYRSDIQPYGGMKHSGLGREGIQFAIDSMTDLRSIVFNL